MSCTIYQSESIAMISCILSKKYLCAGETELCLVKGSSTNGMESFDNSIVFAQIHGHFSADFRWFKSNKRIQEIFVDSPMSFMEKIQLPESRQAIQSPHHSSHCIFATSRIALSPTHIFEGGTFLEFNVPRDSIPTFKGLCATVSYFLTLFIQRPSSTERIDFPLCVHGTGSGTTPFEIM